MAIEFGDRVRLKADSSLRDWLGPLQAMTGKVVAILEEAEPRRINVLYAEAKALACEVLASEFELAAPLVADCPATIRPALRRSVRRS